MARVNDRWHNFTCRSLVQVVAYMHTLLSHSCLCSLAAHTAPPHFACHWFRVPMRSCTEMVTHPSGNRARRRATSFDANNVVTTTLRQSAYTPLNWQWHWTRNTPNSACYRPIWLIGAEPSPFQPIENFYIRQVNAVKLAEIMFSLRFLPSICEQSINRLYVCMYVINAYVTEGRHLAASHHNLSTFS